ncbi:MIP/aquaporin family protein [Rhodotorula paludigena]|uniref:MIP/aquaporin family protein n=1 Tax=Rhodotorula paludigena TaxID=86838 RepID=UPI00316C60E2
MPSDSSHLPLHNPPQPAPSASEGDQPGASSRSRWNWYLRPPAHGSQACMRKNHAIACVGELVGTVLFLFFAFGGTQVANLAATSVTGVTQPGPGGVPVGGGNTSSLFYISMSFGLSLIVTVWTFARISGGLFNPAVTLGLALVGGITPFRAVLLAPVQFLGGIIAAALIDALTPGPLLVSTTLAPGMSPVRGLFLEMFLTTMLLLSILFLAAEKHRSTVFAPVGIGLALAIAELTGVWFTGGSVNPARSLGPYVATASFPRYAWIYFLGPALGAALAAGFYRLLKYWEYETVIGPESADIATARYISDLLQQSQRLGTSAPPASTTAQPKDQSAEVQGPGVSDLLTRQPSLDYGSTTSTAVAGAPGLFGNLPPSPTSSGSPEAKSGGGGTGGSGQGGMTFDQRFDRLEALVTQLFTANRHGGDPREASGDDSREAERE